jgi:alcohol dehydrogenase
VRALLIERFGEPATVHEVPEPVCPGDGVVVAVETSGLCRSDWHGWAGHDPDIVLPHVPGHEFAGRIAAVGAQVRGWSIGQRVTAPFVNACGVCAQCLAGDHQVCPAQTQPGFTRWGSFAERVVVDRAWVNLVALPDEVDALSAAALGCRFATAYRAVIEVGRLRVGEWVAVHGCGGVGLSAVMVARAAGARVVALDVAPPALDLAHRFGADAVLSVRESDEPLQVGERVREVTGGGALLSLDALGSPATASASIASLRPRGRHVQVGLLPAALGWPALPMHLVIGGELEVLGSHGMSPRSYPGLLQLVASGAVRPGELVTRRLTLEQAGPALARMQASGISVVLPGGSDPEEDR